MGSLVDDVAARFRAFPRQLLSKLDERLNPKPTEATILERQIDDVRRRIYADVNRAGNSSSVPRIMSRTLSDIAADLEERNDQSQKVRYRGQSVRVDNFANFGTGIGARGVDKRIGRGRWGYQDVPEFESRFIVRGSDMAQRAVNKVVDEMFREGYRIRIPEDKDLATEQELANREIGLADHVATGLKWARAFGGCGLFLGADDGTKDLSLPLREDRIRTFDYIQPFSPLEMVPVTWYADPLRPKFGNPETYRLTPLDRPPGWSPDSYSLPIIHESRVIALQGTVNWRGQIIYNIHPGWGDSVFVAIRQVLEDFEQAFGGTAILMADFAVATLKLKNLADLLAADGAGLTHRAQAMEDGRSIARVAIIDTEEEFKRESTSVAGLADLIDRFEGRLASAMDLPVELMLGQAPAGLNATGDSTIRWWYGTVSSMQKQKLQPVMERILKLRFLAKNGVSKGKVPKNWSIWFPSLWHPSELEQSTIRLNQANADAVYLDRQVVTPKQIAKSRFGGEEWSPETQVDLSLWDDNADDDHEAVELGLKDDPDAEPPHVVQAAPAAAPGAPIQAAPPTGKAGPLPKGKGKNEPFPDTTRALTTSTPPGGKGTPVKPPGNGGKGGKG